MDSDRESADPSTQRCPVLPMFHSSVGKLHQLLGKGEYALLKDVPTFESDFIQVNRRGEVIDVHNTVHMVTVGVAYTGQHLPGPDVMLLAQPATHCVASAGDDSDTQKMDLKAAESLELTRLLPLKFVKLSIYNHDKKQFQLKLATGRSFYLQLCPPSNSKEDVFAFWEDLVGLLRPPMEAYSGTQAQPAGDMVSIPGLEAEDRRSPSAMELHGQGDRDQVNGSSLSVLSDVSLAASLAYTGGEGNRVQASYCLRRNTPSVLSPAPPEMDRGVAPGAAGTLQASMKGAAVEGTDRRPVSNTADGSDSGPSVWADPDEGSTSKPDGHQRLSPVQAKAPRTSKDKERMPTERLYLLSRIWENTSFLKSQGTPWGDKRENQGSLKERGCGSLLQEYISLSLTQKGSRLSQKLRRSLSRTRSGRVP
ncbi:protein FAM71C-like isoform X2 [Lutra lutra]|nr:protein FAM71C-like isoform X2 [Lutra lutra]XP_047587594.1 protein FAM71C-like isoform X2 [Lutra lutra]